jgi:glycosyltransferase involved in cell wall biosynthesis
MFHPVLRSEAFRARLGYGPDDVVPLFFGRLVLEKGLGLFAETITRLRSQGFVVRPMIVGDGPARDWIARRLPNVAFLGLLEGRELGQAVASADLLVNPSVTEAFGNVNLEAMACGLAVVSADVASASTLIDHGRTGLLVPAHDAGAYAAAVARLIREPARLRALGEAASEAADGFRWDEILAQVVRVYGRLAHHKPALSLAKVA